MSPKPRRWLELALTVPRELVEPLTELFTRRGKAAVSLEETPTDDESPAAPGRGPADPSAWAGGGRPASVTLRGYLPGGVTGSRRRARIETGLALLSLIVPMPPLRSREVGAEEWESVLRGHFTILRVGHSLVVCPLWERYDAKEGEVVLYLDPGASFGTGHHPTTRLCLELLEAHVRPGMTVLDVGTGSGILAIAAAKLGAAHVLGMDTESLAARMARRNVRANAMQKHIKVTHGTIPIPARPRFDLVAANITASVLERLLPLLKDALVPKGTLLLSGILEPQLPGLVARAAVVGLAPVEQRTEADWVALVLRP